MVTSNHLSGTALRIKPLMTDEAKPQSYEIQAANFLEF
jgi:hypothetical protein